MKSPLIKDPLALAPLLSSWLDVAPDRIIVRTGRVELGQGTYAAMSRIVAAEMGLPLEQVETAAASTHTAPNEGITAGSMSISVGGMVVRQAAAVLRTKVIEAASDQLGCAAEGLSISSGRIMSDGSDSGLAVLALAAGVDRNIDVRGTTVIPTPRTTDLPDSRADLRQRICGAPFLQDLQFEGMLHGRVIHPPTAPATLTTFDEAALAARPGVVKVVRDGNFIGVLSDVEWRAVRAADWAHDNVAWAYDDTAPGDPREAIRTTNTPPEVMLEDGTPPSPSSRKVRTTVSRPYLSHGSIGPSAAIAVWQAGKLRVWSHSQGIYPLRAAIAAALRMLDEDVIVSHAPASGCYGHNGADDAAFEAALLARAVPGRHVRLQWSRADEFGYGPGGAAMVVSSEAALAEDGSIAGITVEPASTPHLNRPGTGGVPNLRSSALIGDASDLSPAVDLPLAAGGGADRNADPLYSSPYRKVEKRLVGHLPYRTSSFRTLGAFANILAIEAMMDDVAAETGADPFDLRLGTLSDARGRAVLEELRRRATDLPQGGDGTGWGIGFSQYKNTAAYCAVLATVEVDRDVRVTGIRSVVDAGECVSPDGVRNQIEGGILQAMSWTLKESLPVGAARVRAETWDDYPILRFSEVPPVEVTLIGPEDAAPLGVGEAAAGPTGAALSNAVRHALGVRVPDLPLNRETIERTLLGG